MGFNGIIINIKVSARVYWVSPKKKNQKEPIDNEYIYLSLKIGSHDCEV